MSPAFCVISSAPSRARINLVSSITRLLMGEFAEGRIDIMLTTEPAHGRADILWESPYQANDWRDLVAFVSAGLAVETNMPYMARIKDWQEVLPGAGLPDFGIFLYVREGASPLALQLAGIIRDVDFDPAAMAKSA